MGETPSGAAFLLDDMVFGEADLRATFERGSAPGSDDAGTAPLGARSEELIAETPYGVISYRGAPTIDYCFANPSSWGQENGNILDGFYTAPDLATVAANIAEAGRRWGGVANIRFRHRADLDGNGCDVDLRYSGEIEFWVGHWDGAFGPYGSTGTTAMAPLPSSPHEYQRLLVPPSGIPVDLAIHELGHVLGFRHEHERDEASPRCDADLAAFSELTEYDPGSVMIYANCGVDRRILGLQNPTRLDGIGARVVYGEPHFWWSGIF